MKREVIGWERFLSQPFSKENRMTEPKYKRVVLKLSGEALSGNNGFGIDQKQ